MAGLKPPSLAFSHVHASAYASASQEQQLDEPALLGAAGRLDLPAGLEPQAQVAPDRDAFSVAALSQVHPPAGLARHEHRAPTTTFSEDALSQLQLRADCLPHEHVACWAGKRHGKSVLTSFLFSQFIFGGGAAETLFAIREREGTYHRRTRRCPWRSKWKPW